METDSATADRPSEPGRDGRLERIRVKNFRGLTDLDVVIPKNVQFVCLIGPNGSGKSSLVSLLVDSLVSLTTEQLADDRPDERLNASRQEVTPRLRRSWSFKEIGRKAPLAGLRADWVFDEKRFSTSRVISPYPIGDMKKADVDDVREFLDINSDTPVQGAPNPWLLANRIGPDNDPICSRVVVERPASRHEVPHYEEPADLVLSASVHNRRGGVRLLPIRSVSGVLALERLVLDLYIDANIPQAQGGPATLASLASNRIRHAFSKLSDGLPHWVIPPWPFRRVGVSPVEAFSLLSAGELDILVTAGLIVAQQVYLARRFPAPDRNRFPGGLVFIDEIDAHLHPRWQQIVLPLLGEVFPEIQFVVTTHSPFVLRSSPQSSVVVVRLPDGRVFNEDFASWPVDDILAGVFEAGSQWSPEVATELKALERSVSSNGIDAATALYVALAERSEPLRAECDRIVALHGTLELRDSIRNAMQQRRSANE